MTEPAPPPGYSQPGVPMRRSSYALTSLVWGIVGFLLLPVIGSILAIVYAGKAEKEIAASGGTLGGEGYARAGRTLGIIGVALLVVGLVAAVAAYVAMD